MNFFKKPHEGWYILDLDMMPVYLEQASSTDASGPFESFNEAKEAMLTEIEMKVFKLKEKYKKISDMKEVDD
jgi:hypothetical protein